MKKIFYFAALAAMVASCAKDPMVEPTADSESNMVNVSVDVAMPSTRISIDTDETDWELSWEEDDALSAVDDNGNVTEFTISTYGAASSTFGGSVDGLAETFKLIYPYEAVTTDATGSYYPIDLRVQDGTMDGSTYMISDSAIDVAGTATPSMKHIGSYIKLNMKGDSDLAGTIDGTGVSGDVYVTSVELCDVAAQGQVKLDEDYDSSDLLVTTNGDIMATASGANGFGVNVGNNTKTQTIYLNVLPFEVAAGGSLSFNITLKDSNNTFYGTITTTTESAFSFERGNYHEVPITLATASFKKASSITVNATSLGSYDDQGVTGATADASWTYGDGTFVLPTYGTLDAALKLAFGDDYADEINDKVIITGDMNYADFATLKGNFRHIDMSGVTLVGYFRNKTPDTVSSKTGVIYTNEIPYGAFSSNGFYIGTAANYESLTDATEDAKVLESIKLPANVKKTAYDSFSSATNLTSIEIPDAMTELSYKSFSGCSNLVSVTFGAESELATMGDNVFEKSALTSFHVPSKLKALGKQMFKNVTTLTEVTFASDNTVLVTIKENVFYGCTGLTSLTIPATVTTINATAFAGSSITKLTMLGDVPTSTGATAFPDSFVTEKAGKSNIYVQEIYYDNYADDDYWKTLNINKIASDPSIITINNETAGELADLVTAAKVSKPNATKIVVTGTIDYDDLKSLADFAVVDLSGVTTLYTVADGDTAAKTTTTFPAYFTSNTTLTSMTLPSGFINQIDESAFSGCTNLDYFSWAKPSSGDVTLKNSVFKSCTTLNNTTVNHILSGVTKLSGNNIFQNIGNLTAVVIDGDITAMWPKVFAGCDNLVSITFEGTTTVTDVSNSTLFPGQFVKNYSGTLKQGTVYVPSTSTTGDYKGYATWGTTAFKFNETDEDSHYWNVVDVSAQ